MKAFAIALLLLFGLGTVAVVHAQPAPETSANRRSPHGDQIESLAVCSDTLKQGCTKEPDKGMALLFWAFAAAAVGGALFVVSRKNLIAAVMGMVGSFLGIAAVYMMLYANFLAVVQMLVYAGAIMVLFVFVIMILNRPEDEPVAPTGRAGQTIGGLAIVYLVYRLVMLLVHVTPPNSTIANLAPGLTADGHPWGGVKAVGTDLFTGGIFPFEAISILLLVAVVGAIAIARPLHEVDVPEGTNPNDKRHEGHSV
jgi:NADH-quinone oxidoreductase subunit J